jgi:hypothetical protein
MVTCPNYLAYVEVCIFSLAFISIPRFESNLVFYQLYVQNNANCGFNNHYDKSCPLEAHCFATEVPKQLMYNYTTTRAWKYKQLINKMPCQNHREL